MENYKEVLKGFLFDIKNGRCLYRIEGESNWKEVFISQKAAYISTDDAGTIFYSVPSHWYYGLECPICVNPYNNNLFFNLNDHERAANISGQYNHDYWTTLAEKTRDNNWLMRIKKPGS